MFVISTKTKDIATIQKDSDKIEITATSEQYVNWLGGLISSPLIIDNKKIYSIDKILKHRLYKPFKHRRVNKDLKFKHKKVVKHVI